MATKFEDVYALTKGQKIPKEAAAGVTYNEIKAAVCVGKLIDMAQGKQMENHIKEKLYATILEGKSSLKVEKNGITIRPNGLYQTEKVEVPMDLRLSQNVYVENMMFRVVQVPAPRRTESTGRSYDSYSSGGDSYDSGGGSSNNNNNNA